MKKARKNKWLRALRGKSPRGEYIQGSGRLVETKCDQDHFCCLGVLINEIGEFDHENVPVVDGKRGICDKNLGGLLSKLRLSIREQGTLIEMNDNNRNSFEEIADWIEKNI